MSKHRRKCQTCYFFCADDGDDYEHGGCRLKPPFVPLELNERYHNEAYRKHYEGEPPAPNDAFRGRWPIVSVKDWCGEYVHKDTRDQP